MVVLISLLTDCFAFVVLIWLTWANLPCFLCYITLIKVWQATFCPRTNSLFNSTHQSKQPFPSSFLKFSCSVNLGDKIHSSTGSWSKWESKAVYNLLPTTLLGYHIHEKGLGWHLWKDMPRDNLRNHLAFLSAHIYQCPKDVDQDKRKDI